VKLGDTLFWPIEEILRGLAIESITILFFKLWYNLMISMLTIKSEETER